MINIQAHRTLLERYRASGMKDGCSGGWSDLREDGYIHEHLCWHLEQAGEFEQIVALLQEETVDGRNAWYEVREGLAQTGGYIQDLLRAWQLTRERSRGYVERGEPIATLALEIRFVLMLTSVNSLAANLPVALIGHLVRYGVWKPEVGLAHVRRIPEIRQRSEAFIALASALAATDRVDLGFRMVQEIPDSGYLDAALQAVGAYLTEAHFDIVMGMVREYERSRYLVPLLETIAPFLTDVQRREALSIAREIEDPEYRSLALSGIAPHLPTFAERSALLSEALNIAQMIPDAGDRVEPLTAIALQATPVDTHTEALTEALSIVRRGELYDARGYLTELAPVLTASLLRDTLSQLRIRVREKNEREKNKQENGKPNDAVWYAEQLAEIGSLIPVGEGGEERARLLAEAMAVAQGIAEPNDRIYALVEVVSRLPSGEERDLLLAEALSVTRQLDTSRFRTLLLTTLVPALAESGQTEQALSLVREIPVDKGRSHVLTDMVPHLSDRELQQALTLIRELPSYSWDECEASIASSLAKTGRMEQAVGVARAITRDTSRGGALADLVPYLSNQAEREVVLAEALASVSRIEDSSQLICPLIEMAERLSFLSEGILVLETAEDVALKTRDIRSRSAHLRHITYQMVTMGQFDRVFPIIRKIEMPFWRATALRWVAPMLPQESLDEAFSIIRDIAEPEIRAWGLSQMLLALKNSPHQYLAILAEARALTQILTNPAERVTALNSLLPHLSVDAERTELVREVLGLLPLLPVQTVRLTGLKEIAPHLAPVEMLSALAIVREIEEAEHRAKALEHIAPYLVTQEHIDQALAIARSLDKVWQLAPALIAITSAPAAGEQKRAIILEAFTILREEEYARSLLVNTALCLPDELLPPVFSILSMMESEQTYHMLYSLVPHLNAERLQETLTIAQKMEDTMRRNQALCLIAQRLAAICKIDQALAIIRDIKQSDERASGLYSILYCPEETTADEILSSPSQTRLWTDSQLQKALAMARTFDEYPDYRACALNYIALRLTSIEIRRSLLEESLHVIQESGRSDNGGPDPLQRIAIQLPTFPLADFYPLWEAYQQITALDKRSRMVQQLRELTPSLVKYGDRTTVEATVLALKDVIRWWP